MAPKRPSSPNSYVSASGSSATSSSEKVQQPQEKIQAPSSHPEKPLSKGPPAALPPSVASNDSGSNSEHGDDDDEGRGKVSDDSESESSDCDVKPLRPRRSSRGPGPAVKPICSTPMDGAANPRKRNVPEAANGKPGKKRGKPAPSAASPSRGSTGTAATGGSSSVDGEFGAGGAGASYPELIDALALFEREEGDVLLPWSLREALDLLKPYEAKALRDRWRKHFLDGVKYALERSQLMAELLKSLLEALDNS